MSFFQQLSASLPATDGSTAFKGDRLVAVSSKQTLSYVEQLVPTGQSALDRLKHKQRIVPAGVAQVDADWSARRDGFSLRLRMTVNFPSAADIRRHRNTHCSHVAS
jgi:hypothetical protein